jgi:prepilin-type processing-associated H-X9-DG protein
VWYGEYYYQGWALQYQDTATRSLFATNSSSKIEDIKDGSSNTAMVTETIRDVWNGVPPAWGHAGHVQVGIDFAAEWQKINEFGETDPGWGDASRYKIGRLAQWASAGSLHTGGCQVVFADGSVHFLSQNISSVTRTRLQYIRDNQPVGTY